MQHRLRGGSRAVILYSMHWQIRS